MKFSVSRVPRLQVGQGCLSAVPSSLAALGVSKVMIVTGGHFSAEARRSILESGLSGSSIGFEYGVVRGEPSPELVDALTATARATGCDGVLAVGGGSVIDAGKSVAAACRLEGSIFDYLETVGSRKPGGARLPLVCVPTTAGTGSESTKNAVLSRPGPHGFKKSLRHDNYVPDSVFLDPELQISCPPDVSAASGLDAVTQLLESWLSSQTNPFTDVLALEGLRAAGTSLEKVFHDGADLESRASMSWAAYLSGITLANAGLGAVHGMATVLGGISRIPHGFACGTLLAATQAALVAKARSAGDAKSATLLSRMARAGGALTGRTETSVDALLELLWKWTDAFSLARLASFGLTAADISTVAKVSGNKEALVGLTPGELEAVLISRL